MNTAGVDVPKGKSMVSVLSPRGQVVAKPFEMRHTGSELGELAKYLKSLDGETKVVMEHTGRYYDPTAQYLSGTGIFVSAVNPKLIKDYGNNSLRKVKTDKADSQKTAKYALDNWAELRQYTSMDKIRSGTYEAKRSRISKRGSPELRRTLFLVMDGPFEKQAAGQPGVPVYGQETVRRQAVSGFAGTAARG